MITERAGIPEKERIVEEIREKLSQAQSAILADYRGLSVAEVTELRNRLRSAGVEYRVFKNTLIRRAAHDLGLESLDPYLAGPTAVAFSPNDPVAAAKGLVAFTKDNKNLELKAGVLQGQLLEVNDIKNLAELPSREVLLARVVGGMQAPMRRLAATFQAPLRQLAALTQALAESRS